LTIWRAFFEVYHEVYPRAGGYERRRMICWRQTLLVYVWCFKTDNCVRATEELVSRFTNGRAR